MRNQQTVYKHALITGAAGGIGSAIAHALRSTYPDLHLSLTDVDGGGLIACSESTGGPISTHSLDLSFSDQLEPFCRSITSDQGRNDLLVNCAGVMAMRSFASTDWRHGEGMLNVDLLSPLRLMNLIVPSMVDSRHGCVVNVSSMAGLAPFRGCGYYGAAKAGLAMASEIAALELAEFNVHVVTVYPGPVHSKLEKRARSELVPSRVARVMPVGHPAPLARKISKAVVSRRRRVIYPTVYSWASLVTTFTRWMALRFSPRTRR